MEYDSRSEQLDIWATLRVTGGKMTFWGHKISIHGIVYVKKKVGSRCMYCVCRTRLREKELDKYIAHGG